VLRLTCGGSITIFTSVNSAAILSCFAFALAQIANSQEVITPANRIDLFNGRDFSGWTFCMKNHADPMQTWSATNGVIHCTGEPIGYLRTKQAYSNYVVTVEWRFVKIAPKADNTGVLVHIQPPDKIWPRCIQNQGKSGRQGDLFVMAGAECREHKGLDANTPVPMRGPSVEKPVGEWNTNVTVCAGNDVEAIINGKMMNEITDCTISSGFIGIQSEGGDIEIRRIYLEPLK
jgi:3-keto-disaccharide hydrolase